jgi:hypothetical protein
MLALYAWLMSQPPVKNSPPMKSHPFPMNVRPSVAALNWLFYEDSEFKPLPSKSASTCAAQGIDSPATADLGNMPSTTCTRPRKGLRPGDARDALIEASDSPTFYVGAAGSRRNRKAINRPNDPCVTSTLPSGWRHTRPDNLQFKRNRTSESVKPREQ